jgi:hypothetical protein
MTASLTAHYARIGRPIPPERLMLARWSSSLAEQIRRHQEKQRP